MVSLNKKKMGGKRARPSPTPGVQVVTSSRPAAVPPGPARGGQPIFDRTSWNLFQPQSHQNTLASVRKQTRHPTPIPTWLRPSPRLTGHYKPEFVDNTELMLGLVMVAGCPAWARPPQCFLPSAATAVSRVRRRPANRFDGLAQLGQAGCHPGCCRPTPRRRYCTAFMPVVVCPPSHPTSLSTCFAYTRLSSECPCYRPPPLRGRSRLV